MYNNFKSLESLDFSCLNLEKLSPFEKSLLAGYIFTRNLEESVKILSLVEVLEDADEESEHFLSLVYEEYVEEKFSNKLFH